MANRATIGFYDSSPSQGGPSRYVRSILAALDPDEFQVRIFGRQAGPYVDHPGMVEDPDSILPAPATSTPSPSPGPKPEASQPIAKRLVGRLPVGKLPRIWMGMYRDSRRLARWFRRHPVDLLHTNDTGCDHSPVAARLAGIPHVLGTFHVDSTYDLEGIRSGLAHRGLEYLSNRCLHLAIGVSEETGRDWIRRTGISERRVVTIHNGIDAERFRRRVDRAEARRRLGLDAEDATILGGVGRLDPAKGFGDLIEAFALIVRDRPGRDLRLVLAGEGPLRPTLEAQVARLGLADRIRFLGFQRDIQGVLDALDVYVLSSWCEALPYALLEAMATGLPTVGTRVGGVPEMVVPGETGFLVPSRDPLALAEALGPLVDSADLRERLGPAGRERVVRHFREDEMVRRTIEAYRELLAADRPKASASAARTEGRLVP